MTTKHFICNGLPAALALALALSAAPAAARDWAFYGRIGYGLDHPRNSVFRDAERPEGPRLFGAERHAAHGEFDFGGRWEMGAGLRVSSQWRAELMMVRTDGLEFSGDARFANSGDSQPASGEAEALAMLGAVYFDFPMVAGVRPYVGGGFGRTNNETGPVRYEFPAFDRGANGEFGRTIAPSGSSDHNYRMLAAGLTAPVSDNVALDIGYRFSDFGEVQTDSGMARVVRYNADGSLNRDIQIPVGKTRAELQSHGFTAAVRVEF